MKLQAKALMIFGAYLIVAGVVGYLSNPEKAKTALMSGGLFGSINLVLGFLASRGMAWPRIAGIAVCGLLSLTFIWRASVGWMAVAGGNSDKLVASSLITSMLVGALITLRLLLRRDQLQSNN